MGNRSFLVKAKDGYGNVLPDATFKFMLDGELVSTAGKGGDGVASLYNFPDTAKLEIEVSYGGESIKRTFGNDVDSFEFEFEDQMAPPLAGTDKIDTRMFVVGCILLIAALGMGFWAFSLGTMTPDQRMIAMWLLPLASGFGAGAFTGSMTVKVQGALPGIIATATGGFAVWLLSYFLLPVPGETPQSRADEEFAIAGSYLALASQPGGQELPNLQKALAHFDNAGRQFGQLPGNEVEHLASVGAQGLVSEKMAYVGSETGRVFELQDGEIVATAQDRGDAISLRTPDLQQGELRCTDVTSAVAWDVARTHYLAVSRLLHGEFARPSANTPMPIVRNARNAAYFLICDCLLNGVDHIEKAKDALSVVRDSTDVTNLNIKGRYDDAVAKLALAETLGNQSCTEFEAHPSSA